MAAGKLLRELANHWRIPAIVVALAASLLAGVSGAGSGVERGLADSRYAFRHHQVSSDVVIVEIDARSIAAIDRWPWPRGNYVGVVDRLRRAGAASVAFDVDFSVPSNPADDAALAQALARADGLVTLPTFRQPAGSGQRGFVDSMPIPILRQNALAATVSILPDSDGDIRNAPLGEITAGIPRPSLAAMIAGRNGRAGADFPIDYSIDPASIPRLSFIDVRDGRFDPMAVRGKRILIGATAIELGDRYGVPRYGVIPGVVIQALAALTLEKGVPTRLGWGLPLLFAFLLTVPMLRARSSRLLVASGIGATVLLIAGSIIASSFGWEVELIPALLAIYVVAIGASLVRANAWFAVRRAHDDATGLPNQHALAEALDGKHGAAVAAVHVAEYDRLLAALGAEGIVELICRLRDRISVIGGGIEIYRVDDRVLAWEATIRADQLAVRHEQLRAVMLSPIEVKGRRVDVSLATGFAAMDEGSSRDAIANAAMAAYHALSSGTGWHLHEASDSEMASKELSLAGDVDAAIANGDVFVVYQPKLDLKTGKIVSVEALVRWRHPDYGMLAPDLFIPLLEKSDRIAGLTLHVIASAIADINAWLVAGHRLTAAVNLSAILLESAPFIADLEERLRTSAIDPTLLTFEVTESAAMHAPDVAAASLLRFKQLGISISMDDYGTGQSTLTYLKTLPLDELKIDRSFVEFAHQNRGDAVLVRSTVNLAHELGLKVVAEGVETDECLDFLKSVGCDLAQGYLVSSPIAPTGIVELVRGADRAGPKMAA